MMVEFSECDADEGLVRNKLSVPLPSPPPRGAGIAGERVG